MRALLIKEGPMREILDGKKTWEIRGSSTTIRERIGLIQSKSGHIVGVCDLVDCKGPLTVADMIANVEKHRIPKKRLEGGLYYRTTYAWVLRNARRLTTPIPYQHPSGAIIWVKLDGTAAGRQLAGELGRPTAADVPPLQAVEDWLYWVKMGWPWEEFLGRNRRLDVLRVGMVPHG